MAFDALDIEQVPESLCRPESTQAAGKLLLEPNSGTTSKVRQNK
jgi:hypothetical protein